MTKTELPFLIFKNMNLKAGEKNLARVTLTFILYLIVSHSVAQNSPRKNTLFYELYGTGLGFVSLNYERVFQLSEKVLISPGVGLSLTKMVHVGETETWNDNQIFLPFQVNFLFGKNSHKVELGYGMPFALREKGLGLVSHIYMMRIGYRYQSKKNGLMLKASLNPGISVFIPFLWGGVGIGFSF